MRIQKRKCFERFTTLAIVPALAFAPLDLARLLICCAALQKLVCVPHFVCVVAL